MVVGESLTERQRRGMKMLQCAQALKTAANHDPAKKLGSIFTDLRLS
jgi:hypothetical protein